MKAVECSFCKQSYNNADCIIRGHSGYICNNCVGICVDMIQESNVQMHLDNAGISTPNLYPQDIYDELSKEVIGQHEAKKIIAVAGFMHLQRIKSGAGEKSNVLLIGPTGSGKTLLIKTLANIMKVPAVIIDATSLSETGYAGEDVEIIGQRLYYEANKDLVLAEHGIVFIDEIDKIAKSAEHIQQVSRVGVQRGLLTVLEDTTLPVNAKNNLKSYNNDQTHLKTKNILFICSGAFVGLDKIINKNKQKPGFCRDEVDAVHSGIKHEHLVEYGLIEEFVARLPIIAKMNKLSEAELVQMIHTSESSPLKKYKRTLSNFGIQLKITDEATQIIAQKAIASGAGARGVKIELESIISNAVFNIKRSNIKGIMEIKKEDLESGETPQIVNTKKHKAK